MLSFFQGLADVILRFGGWFLPFTVVKVYEGGVLLRFGRFQREIEPGLVWHIPFNVDQVLKTNVVYDSARLKSQALTTADGISVLVGVSIGYRVTVVRKFLLEVEDSDTVVGDASCGVLQEQIKATNWADIQQPAFQDQVYKAVRRRAFRFGATIENVFWVHLVKTGLKEGVIFHLGDV